MEGPLLCLLKFPGRAGKELTLERAEICLVVPMWVWGAEEGCAVLVRGLAAGMQIVLCGSQDIWFGGSPGGWLREDGHSGLPCDM